MRRDLLIVGVALVLVGLVFIVNSIGVLSVTGMSFFQDAESEFDGTFGEGESVGAGMAGSLMFGLGVLFILKSKERKKGQVAMEFLMTYGWAILAAILAMGVLAYFGVFSPERLVGGSALLNAPFFVDAYNAESGTGGNNDIINLELFQTSGKALRVSNVDFIGLANGVDITCTFTGDLIFSSNEIKLVTLDCGGDFFDPGDLIRGDLIVNYTLSGSSLSMKSTGNFVGRGLEGLGGIGELIGNELGLVGLWHLNENAGSTSFIDSTGSTSDATCVGAECPTAGVVGQLGNAVENDGIDDKIITNLANLDGLVSLSAWIYPRDWGPSNDGRILSGEGPSGFGHYLQLEGDGGQNTLGFAAQFDVTNGVWRASNGVISLNSGWYYVVVTYDSSSVQNDPMFYVDGVPVNVIEVAEPGGVYNGAGAGDYIIGNRDTGSSRAFDGFIDEVSVWDRVLLSTEVDTFYQNGLG